jgi:hypothetical protein
VIAAAKPFVAIRLDKVKDKELWEKYDVDGVGVFFILDSKGEVVDEVKTSDLRQPALVQSFRETLTDQWEAQQIDAKQITWQKDLAAARAVAAKSGKPIATVFVKLAGTKKDEKRQPDAKSAILLEWLDEIPMACLYDRYVWVQIPWRKQRPPEAKELGVSRAPTVIAVAPDGKRLAARPQLKSVAGLAATLAKAATKIEAVQARKRARKKKKTS